MSPLLSLSLLLALLSLLAVSLAEVVSLRSPVPSNALDRPALPRYPSPPPFNSAPNPDLTHDLTLLDIVLVASVDGKFHALNRTSGQILWSMSSGAPAPTVSAPPTLRPLVRTTHMTPDPDLTDDAAPGHELYIIEPQSGDIYVLPTPDSPLQRFPFSMPELVDMSPFSFEGDDEKRVFVGRKETSLVLVELETGRVNSECPWDPFEDFVSSGGSDEGEVDLDELEGSKPPVKERTEVFIGRTDYHISIYSHPHSARASSRAPVQNLSFSTYGPNNQDSLLQASYRRTKDDAYIQSLSNGDVLSFKAVSPSPGKDKHPELPMWGHTFHAPIVAVFDVLVNSTSNEDGGGRKPHPFVLLQPRPRLNDLLPTLSPAQLDPESAYVGIVEETGSLFALSPERYPFVSFGGGSEPQRLIDAPEGAIISIEDPEEVEDPLPVDEITRMRKLKEREAQLKERAARLSMHARCSPSAGPRDPRCVVGIRKLLLEGDVEGRINRLLEGPAGAYPYPPPSSGSGSGSGSGRGWGENNSERLAIGAGHEREEKLMPGGRLKGWEDEVRAPWEVLALSLVVGMLSVGYVLRRFRLKSQEKLLRGAGTGAKFDVRDMGAVLEEVRPVQPRKGHSVDSFVMVDKPLPDTPLEREGKGASGNGKAEGEEEEKEKEKENQKDAGKKDVGKDLDGDDADADDDVEGDADGAGATPTKRKGGRRGKRGGRKKKPGALGLASDEKEEAKENEKGTADAEVKSPLTPSMVINSSPRLPVPGPSLVVSDTILGFGSHGTVVFQGSLQGRAVAVKRLLQDFVTLASREVSILQESDDHPNVIRYYYQEARANFLYIALELCPCSLADLVEAPDREAWRDIAIGFDPKRALRQITSGLRHLHALKLVHRDIKPQNILVSGAKQGAGGGGKGGAYRMLISDFGLCKKLDVDQTSFLPTAHGAMAAGTVGWRAPEILRGEVKLDDVSDDASLSSRGSVATIHSASGATPTPGGSPARLTKSVDIFALGCLFYYTLTGGGHPYGDRFEREVNILKNDKNLGMLERFGEEGTEAADLIERMLDPEAKERPDTTTILLHPFFWDPGRRLNFLQDASDRFEIMCREPKDRNLLELEKEAASIVGNDWHVRLDKVFIENLGKFRKYDGRSVQDLLRALRNKKHHYQDLPDNVKRHLGPMPEGFLSYFTRRYPQLFLHVHAVISDTGLSKESMFRAYFELPDS